MVIAIAIVGLLYTHFFGKDAGYKAAGAAAMLFLVAMMVPPLTTIAYAAVGVGVAFVCWVGPRLDRPRGDLGALGNTVRNQVLRLWKKKTGG